MAKFVFKNAQVIINSVNLSSQVEQITLESKSDEVETTAFGDAARDYAAGLQTNKVTIAFYQDYSTSSVHQTLAPLQGTTVACSVQPMAGATATTNPVFTFTALVTQYQPVDGKVGDAAKLSLTWPVTTVFTEVD